MFLNNKIRKSGLLLSNQLLKLKEICDFLPPHQHRTADD